MSHDMIWIKDQKPGNKKRSETNLCLGYLSLTWAFTSWPTKLKRKWRRCIKNSDRGRLSSEGQGQINICGPTDIVNETSKNGTDPSSSCRLVHPDSNYSVVSEQYYVIFPIGHLHVHVMLRYSFLPHNFVGHEHLY